MFFTWLRITLKLHFKKKAFIALLILFPVISVFFHWVYTDTQREISVGIMWDEKDSLSNGACEYLLKNQNMIRFIKYDTRYNMEQDVRTQKIAWAYDLKDALEEKLKQGRARNIIECIETPNSFLSHITDEIVFSAIMREYAGIYLIEYTQESGLFSDDVLKKAMEVLPKEYKRYRDDSEAFHFSYETIESIDTKSVKGFAIMPIQGIGAVLILLSALYGGVLSYEFEKKGLYKRLSLKNRKKAILISILSPTICISVSVLFSFFISDSFHNIFFEIISLCSYVLSAITFSFMLRTVISKEAGFCGILPVITIGTVLFTPVFFDITLVLPVFHTVSYVFLPYYYLKGHSIILFLLFLLFFLAGNILYSMKNRMHKIN